MTQTTLFGLPEANPDADSDWYCTPPEILEPVYRFWPEGIDLDPCSNPHSLVKAKRSIMLPENGLMAKWKGRIWLNPPYSDPGPWLQMAREAFTDECAEILQLVKVDTSTRWWQENIWLCDAICFPNERVRFYLNGERTGSPNFASALAYHGLRDRVFDDVFQGLGHCITP